MEVSDEDQKPQLTILLHANGRTLRLGAPAKWLRAVELGDLSPETPIEAVGPARRYEGPASGVPELRAIFDRRGLISAEPEAPVDEKSTTEVATEANDDVKDDPDLVSDLVPEGAPDEEPDEEPPEAPMAPPVVVQPPARGSAIWIVVVGALVVGILGFAASFSTSAPEPTAPTAQEPTTTVEPAIPPAQFLEAGTTASWNSAKDVEGQVYLFEDYRITFNARLTTGGQKAPVITIERGTDRPLEIVGAAWTADAEAEVTGGRMDAAIRGPVLLLSWYTGGAHCCTEVMLITSGPAGLVGRRLGASDSGMRIDDLDGDGIGELISSDERFLYAFASYAESVAPPWVRTMQDRVITDANDQPAYRRIFEAALPDTEKACLTHNNGGCAAFVAIAARLGRADWGWALMMENYDRSSSWTLPVGCSGPRAGETCPSGQEIVYPDFPTALAAFLTEAGYGPLPEIRGEQDAAELDPETQPEAQPEPVIQASFDCARADNAVLRLICATPLLADSDLRLDAAYRKAMARTDAPLQLRDEQRDWIFLRNSGPAEVGRLLRMYEERIKQLNKDRRQ